MHFRPVTMNTDLRREATTAFVIAPPSWARRLHAGRPAGVESRLGLLHGQFARAAQRGQPFSDLIEFPFRMAGMQCPTEPIRPCPASEIGCGNGSPEPIPFLFHLKQFPGGPGTAPRKEALSATASPEDTWPYDCLGHASSVTPAGYQRGQPRFDTVIAPVIT